ncbi:MAG: 3-coathanger stack domain-containing protein, partial [Bacteroidota bacterium]
MKKQFFTLLILFLSSCFLLQAQFYGVGFDQSLALSGGAGGWSSSSNSSVFWTTTSVAPITISGINTTPQNGAGFAYTETDGTFSGSQAIAYLESPCFDLVNTVDRIQFFYQISGAVDSFYLEVSYDNGISYSEQVLNIPIATYSDWERENNTSVSINGSVRFRFAAVFNSGSSSIVTLDQLQLFGAQQNDAMDCPDLDCVENLTLNNTTLSEDFYRAKDQLSSNATIAANEDVTFTAGNQIVLRAGFVASNTTFTARVADCNSVGTSLLEDYARPNPLSTPDTVDYFDRFGNAYSRQELEIMRLEGSSFCETGVFRLSFDSSIPLNQREVICAVFNYLDGLISVNPNVNDGDVIIDIRQDESLGAATPAAASPVWNKRDCGIANSAVEKILIGGNPNQFGFVHGYIKINPDFNNQFYTDLNLEPDPSVDNDKIHFYTIMLHEALHILGFASLIEDDTTPLDIILTDNIKLEGGAYSRYDQYLFSLTESDFLLAPVSGICCDEHEYQLTNSPSAGCEKISFRDGMNDIASVNGTLISNTLNLLSHFNSNCDAGKDYVMHPFIPEIGRTDGRATAIRDEVTCEELQVLALIGYDVATAITANPDCSLPNSTLCDVAVSDELFAYDPVDGDLNVNIPIADIVMNDYIPNGYDDFDYSIIPDPNFAVSDDGTDLMITISNSESGTYIINYTLTACSGAVCDDGVIKILISGCVLDPQLSPCENCDVLCDDIGNFECVDDQDALRLFYTGQRLGEGDQSAFQFIGLNSVNLVRSGFGTFATCVSDGIQVDELVSIRPQEGNKAAAILASVNNVGTKISGGLVIPLCEEIELNEEVEVSLYASCMVRPPDECSDPRPSLRIEFMSGEPELGMSVYNVPGVDVTRYRQEEEIIGHILPPNITSYDLYTFTFTNETLIEGFTHLLISGITANDDNAIIFVDNIRVTKQKSITINAIPSTTNLCRSGRVDITYEITNNHCSPSGDLSIDIPVPAELALLNTGFFADGSLDLPMESLAPFETRTIQAIFFSNTSAHNGQNVDIQLDVSPADMNSCYSASSNIQPINLIGSPFSSLTKSFVIEGDGDYRFELELCNSLEQSFDRVQIIDNIPPEFDLITDNVSDDPFLLISDLGGKRVQLFTSIGAASGGTDFCQSYFYTLRPNGNFCPGTFVAVANLADSGCDNVRDEVFLEDSGLAALDADFTFNVNCVNGLTTFTSNEMGSGVTHFWEFEPDGNTSTDVNPTYTLTEQRTYTVTHTVSNACEELSITKSIDFIPCPPMF